MRVLFLILLSLASQSAPKAVNKTKTVEGNKKAQYGRNEAVLQGFVSDERVVIEEISAAYQQSDSYDPRTDRLYRLYLKATIGGVIIALIGIGFIWFQTRATKHSVDSLRSAERAWILVTLDHPEGPHARYDWALSIKNCGRTPARVTLAFGDLTDTLELGEPPTYKPSILPSPKLLAPQEEWQIADVSSLYRTELTGYYGYIGYRDTFSDKGERITRFCYELRTVKNPVGGTDQKWFPAGPQSYNDYT